MAAINMSVPDLVRFLDEGAWLNIYEAVAKTGLKDEELKKEVCRRLGRFWHQREKIDRLLQFQEDMHYASLNLGGAGEVLSIGV